MLLRDRRDPLLCELAKRRLGGPQIGNDDAAAVRGNGVHRPWVVGRVSGVLRHLGFHAIVDVGAGVIHLDQDQHVALDGGVNLVVHGVNTGLRLRNPRLGQGRSEPLLDKAAERLLGLPQVDDHQLAALVDGRHVADQPVRRIGVRHDAHRLIDAFVLVGRDALPFQDHHDRHRGSLSRVRTWVKVPPVANRGWRPSRHSQIREAC